VRGDYDCEDDDEDEGDGGGGVGLVMLIGGVEGGVEMLRKSPYWGVKGNPLKGANM